MSTYSNWLQPALQNLLQLVVRFFHSRSSCTTMHISADVQRITLNASCMTISGGRTKQLYRFCRITGFTSDFLSFIVVELIQFFHGALQLLLFLCWANEDSFFLSALHFTKGASTSLLLDEPCVGSGVVRIDPLHFLAGCHTRWLNQA